MTQREPKFGPDMRDVRFKADVGREAARPGVSSSGVFLNQSTGELAIPTAQVEIEIVSRFRRRWLGMLLFQLVTVIAITGWVMFAFYQPDLPVSSPVYVMNFMMIAGSSLGVGFCSIRSFDMDSQDRVANVAKAYVAQFMPLGGLVSWAVCMCLFLRMLHGWDPGAARFFVSNPYGLLVTGWMIGILAMHWLLVPLITVVGSRRGRALMKVLAKKTY